MYNVVVLTYIYIYVKVYTNRKNIYRLASSGIDEIIVPIVLYLKNIYIPSERSHYFDLLAVAYCDDLSLQKKI